LFDLAVEGNTAESVDGELVRLAAAASAPEIEPVLRNPMLSPSRRRELAELLAREFAVSDLLARFLALLADRRRLDEVPAIAAYFRILLDERLGRVRATIRAASGLEDGQKQSLVETFSQLTGKAVLAEVVVDAELLGGVLVEVAGRVYDGSVRTHFERLAKQFASSGSI
jgi:F-type H+-transporting ATPase subunit delta